MADLNFKQFSRRHRPHIHPPGRILFLTFRLAGSIPQGTVRLYKAKKDWLADQLARVRRIVGNSDACELQDWLKQIEQFNRDWFFRFEDILHRASHGPMWMQDSRVADKVAENLHRLDGDAYRLDAYSIMSNHVHTVFQPFLSEQELREAINERGEFGLTKHPGLSRIMHSLKGRSARECNLILCRSGQFWEHESFDHVIRPGKFDATVRYVLNNPVKAGLVKHWREWRWNYCREELLDKF